MTEQEAIEVAIEELSGRLDDLLWFGPKSPKHIRRNAFTRAEYRRLNDARRILRRMRARGGQEA